MELTCNLIRVYQNYSLKRLRDVLVEDPRNEEAWSEFFQRFDKIIYRMVGAALRRYPNTPAYEIGDFAQTVYCRLMENAGSALRNFRGATEAELYGYLARIIYHLIVEAHRRHINELSLSVEISALEDHLHSIRRAPALEPTQEYTLQQRELQDLVENVLQQCGKKNSDRDRLIFILRLYDGYSAKDIAEVFNISIDYVNTIYCRVKKRIVLDFAKRRGRTIIHSSRF